MSSWGRPDFVRAVSGSRSSAPARYILGRPGLKAGHLASAIQVLSLDAPMGFQHDDHSPVESSVVGQSRVVFGMADSMPYLTPSATTPINSTI